MSFTERLKAARDKGILTVSDMAVWFGVTRASMSTWLTDGKTGGRCPWNGKAKQLEPHLAALEGVLNSPLEIFPIPLSVRQYERREYIEKVKHAALKLSPAGAASRGRKVLGRNK